MKRSTKNFSMTVIVLILFFATIYTMNYIKTNTTNTVGVPNINNNMNSNNNFDNSNKEGSSEKNIPNNNSTINSNQSPEKTDGNNNDNNGDNSFNNNQPPNDNMNNMVQNSNKISAVYYVIFGIESILISSIIIYLIMSKFNKKSFKETYSNIDKAIIYILSLIIMTFGVEWLCLFVTNNYFLSDSNSSNINNNKNNITNNNSISYKSQKELEDNENITSGDFSSTTSDENAVSASGNISASLSSVNITKTGDSDGGDNTSFYGTNSGIIAKSGANLILKNINVETNAVGSNGVFSYGGTSSTSSSSGDGTVVNISDSKITTKKDNSGGIMTTGGGSMNATNLVVNTAGTSSAAIRSDRGGGEVKVSKGTYTTTGKGSPAIYSTANITVNDAKLISKKSEGVVVEGKNSITLNNTTLTDTNTELNGKSTTYKNIFIYQSMSGDADDGVNTFTAKNSKIITNKGDTIYVTNTKSNVVLENNTFINKDNSGSFLRIQKDSWGNNGSNGGEVTLNLKNQKVNGNIVVDSISTLYMKLENNSSYEGQINKDNTAKSITLVLDKNSKIKLTGNTYVTKLENAVSNNSNIDFNGCKLYVNGTAIN